MFVQSYNANLNTSAYFSNNRSNKESSFDLNTLVEPMKDNSNETAKSGGVLFESFGLIRSDGTKTSPLKISYDENYSSDNPVLIIETKDQDGNTINSRVNINNINPNNATVTEMLSLISNSYKDNLGAGFKAQTFFRYKSIGQAASSNDGNIDNTAQYMEEKNNWNTLLKNNMDLYLKVGDVNSYAQSKDLLNLISR